jgi:choline dehydrogenase-like flavoprotein
LADCDAEVTLMDMDTNWDCIVVGAGAAGLSAALVLGRARRRTLVIDAGGQSNRAAEGIGGLLGHDGRPPDEFYAAGRDGLAPYPSVEQPASIASNSARSMCSGRTPTPNTRAIAPATSSAE